MVQVFQFGFFRSPGDFNIGVLSFASIGSSPLLMTPHDHLQAHGTSAPEGNQNKLKWLQVTKFTLFQYNNIANNFDQIRVLPGI